MYSPSKSALVEQVRPALTIEHRIGPFLKWAGGKSQILKSLAPLFPKNFERYFEPFLGGGAVLFYLLSQRPNLKAFVSDANPELINCYLRIKDNVDEVIDELKLHRNDKHHFYKIREQIPTELDPAERAARLIYLNKTCFNGLYRENRSGQFNVPFGKYKNPPILDQGKLLSVSRALNRAHVQFNCSSFERALVRARAGDFVYLDPPYHPLDATSNFTSYTKGSFARDDQLRLSTMFRELDRRGCYLMMSNSNSALIQELYGDFKITEVLATRAINCKPDRRGRIKELVVRNY